MNEFVNEQYGGYTCQNVKHKFKYQSNFVYNTFCRQNMRLYFIFNHFLH